MPIITGSEKLKHIYHNNRQVPIALIDQGVVSGAGFLGDRRFGWQDFSDWAVTASSRCRGWWCCFLAAFNRPSWSRLADIAPEETRAQSATRVLNMMFCSSWFRVGGSGCHILFCRFSSLMFSIRSELRSVEIIMPLMVLTFVMNEFFRKMFFRPGRNITALVLITLFPTARRFVGLVRVAYLHQLNLQRAILLSPCRTVFHRHTNSESETYRVSFRHSAHLKETWNYSGWLIGTSLLQWFPEISSLLQRDEFRSGSSEEQFGWRRNIIRCWIYFSGDANFIPSNAAKIYHDKDWKSLRLAVRMVTGRSPSCSFFALLFSRQIMMYCMDMITWSMKHVFVWICIAFGLVCIYRFCCCDFSFAPWRKPRHLHCTTECRIQPLTGGSYGERYIRNERVFAGLILTQVIIQLWYLYSLKSELVVVWK